MTAKKRRSRKSLTPIQRRSLAFDVAKRRCEYRHTTESIADDLDISEGLVSSLYSFACDERLFVVQATDAGHVGTNASMGRALSETFDLDHSIVVDSPQVFPAHAEADTDRDDYLHEVLGSGAATFIHTAIRDGDCVGVGGGRAVYSVVKALHDLPPLTQRNIMCCSLTGNQDTRGWGKNYWDASVCPSADADFISMRLEACFHHDETKAIRVNSPLAFDSSRARDDELDRQRKRLSKSFPRAWPNAVPDVAIVGIGALNENHSFLRFQKGAELQPIASELRSLVDLANAIDPFPVYDICNKLYYIDGINDHREDELRSLIGTINSKTISMTMDELLQVSKVIVIAGGGHKRDAIWGALAGESIGAAGIHVSPVDELYTDSQTAEELIERGQRRLRAD